ncbi:sigma-70 family RNA polymerase sigma factor [Agathobaculum hominis]|uniref:Sigma-70 family RNA polymerase sigma factor n=1 Tax=Agathobaculum hominis TaxID=2763014 RepID=A0ABR7GMI0_9FIRM|nr:sigma-70 family RNA polymerase sigma factor [Agathobaculum hominis]MBC5695524.1 sigma-70 family RNA polymerase sigma factor [Agathobaculum hominis]
MTERMTALLRRASEGDREAESALVSENSGLIHTIARRYFGRGAEPDDLYQLACVGFIKAVRGFDPARGNEFSTYAVPKIAGEIRRFLRDDGAVKVSRAVKERAVRVRRVQSELEGRLGRSPSVSELAAACSLTPEEVAVCEQADVSVDSLERELSGGGRLGDLVGDEGMEERTCLYLSLEGALQSLPERERQVIALRFARDMTQQQVSRIIGVSQVQVSRIEKRALAALRERLCDT